MCDILHFYPGCCEHFVQHPRLKMKKDWLQKLSRDHLVEEAGWALLGSAALPGAEESGEGFRRGQRKHDLGYAGQADVVLW